MSDKLQALLQFLESQIRIIAFLVGGALLGGVYYISVTESSLPSSAPTIDSAVTPPPPSPVSPFLQKEMDLNDIPIEDSPFKAMISNSMFDPHKITEQGDLAKLAMQKYQQALRAYGSRDYREALTCCDEALTHNPTHALTLELKKKVEKAINNRQGR